MIFRVFGNAEYGGMAESPRQPLDAAADFADFSSFPDADHGEKLFEERKWRTK